MAPVRMNLQAMPMGAMPMTMAMPMVMPMGGMAM